MSRMFLVVAAGCGLVGLVAAVFWWKRHRTLDATVAIFGILAAVAMVGFEWSGLRSGHGLAVSKAADHRAGDAPVPSAIRFSVRAKYFEEDAQWNNNDITYRVSIDGKSLSEMRLLRNQKHESLVEGAVSKPGKYHYVIARSDSYDPDHRSAGTIVIESGAQLAISRYVDLRDRVVRREDGALVPRWGYSLVDPDAPEDDTPILDKDGNFTKEIQKEIEGKKKRRRKLAEE